MACLGCSNSSVGQTKQNFVHFQVNRGGVFFFRCECNAGQVVDKKRQNNSRDLEVSHLSLVLLTKCYAKAKQTKWKCNSFAQARLVTTPCRSTSRHWATTALASGIMFLPSWQMQVQIQSELCFVSISWGDVWLLYIGLLFEAQL